MHTEHICICICVYIACVCMSLSSHFAEITFSFVHFQKADVKECARVESMCAHVSLSMCVKITNAIMYSSLN